MNTTIIKLFFLLASFCVVVYSKNANQAIILSLGSNDLNVHWTQFKLNNNRNFKNQTLELQK